MTEQLSGLWAKLQHVIKTCWSFLHKLWKAANEPTLSGKAQAVVLHHQGIYQLPQETVDRYIREIATAWKNNPFPSNPGADLRRVREIFSKNINVLPPEAICWK
jgi:hypothetical protein